MSFTRIKKYLSDVGKEKRMIPFDVILNDEKLNICSYKNVILQCNKSKNLLRWRYEPYRSMLRPQQMHLIKGETKLKRLHLFSCTDLRTAVNVQTSQFKIKKEQKQQIRKRLRIEKRDRTGKPWEDGHEKMIHRRFKRVYLYIYQVKNNKGRVNWTAQAWKYICATTLIFHWQAWGPKSISTEFQLSFSKVY